MGLESLIDNVVGLPGGGINNLTITVLSPEIISRMENLIVILKAAGIIFIGYVIFLILRWFFTFRKYRITKKMYKKINEMDRKLDALLVERKIRTSKEKTEVIKKKIENKKMLKKLKK